MQAFNKALKEAGGKTETLSEVSLEGNKMTKIPSELTAALEGCKNLALLTLSNCGLESLDGLPKCPLEGIDLSNNKYQYVRCRLPDGEFKVLKNYTRLNQLLVSENNISKIETLKELGCIKALSELDASGNPVAEAADYRATLFEAYFF